MYSIRIKTMALAATALIAMGGTAYAEQGPAATMDTESGQQGQMEMQMEPSQDPGQSSQFDTEKLDAYAEAALQIGRINAEMAPEIRAADSEQERKTKTLEMQQEMVTAIQETSGITMQEYNEISLALRQDPQLANQVRELFDEKVLRLRQEYEQQPGSESPDQPMDPLQ